MSRFGGHIRTENFQKSSDVRTAFNVSFLYYALDTTLFVIKGGSLLRVKLFTSIRESNDLIAKGNSFEWVLFLFGRVSIVYSIKNVHFSPAFFECYCASYCIRQVVTLLQLLLLIKHVVNQLHLVVLNLPGERRIVQLLNDSLLDLWRHTSVDGWG